MRLIDADALWESVGEIKLPIGSSYGMHFVAFRLKEAFNAAPTIDAVPVVRCNDCEFYSQRFGGACTYHNADPYEMPGFPPNGFCSYGIRRDGGQQDG